ncbi:alpha/beta fold hydrolase [Spongiimicrobium salis]|uniref:alpha/beta fold hydrolase n=1 Tax=Spongiimicrobium salis TaxID=1667022 RepID=UPI00374CC917
MKFNIILIACLCVQLCLAQEPKNGIATFKTRIVKEGMGKALKWYENQKKTGNPLFQMKEVEELAYAFVEQGKYDEGLELLRLNLKEFPNTKNAFQERYLCNIAEYLWTHNLPKKAKLFLELNMKVHSDSERAHRTFGDYYLSLGQEILAVKYYKEAARLNPRNNLFQIAFKANSNDYRPTVIPKDTLRLFKHMGEFNNPVAFVYVQGGPDLELNIHDNDALHLFPNSDNLLKIYPLQAAMLNPELVVSLPNLTEAQSDFENQQSAEILHRTLSYLKNRGKTVHLIGHSYGGSIVMEYLLKYPSNADKIVIMGKDFDEDMRSYEGLKSGSYIRWKDGVEPVLKPFFRNLSETFIKANKLNAVVDNLTMLVKTHSAKRFTKLLRHKDLSNITFVHARFDEANGRVSQEELLFLRSKGVKTIETFGDHHSMFTRSFMTQLYHSLASGRPLKKAGSGFILQELEKGAKSITPILSQWELQKKNYMGIDENAINNLGYHFMGRNELHKALIVFQLNVHWFPDSANVYDSLGEAYLKMENKELAIKNYEKTLAMRPDNPNAQRILQELKEK